MRRGECAILADRTSFSRFDELLHGFPCLEVPLRQIIVDDGLVPGCQLEGMKGGANIARRTFPLPLGWRMVWLFSPALYACGTDTERQLYGVENESLLWY